MLKSAQNETVLNDCNKFMCNYGPFGSEKIKILDHAFRSIIENML